MMNSAVTQTLTLSSTGTADLTVSSATITGAGFTIIGGTFPERLSAGQTLALQIQFLPVATGSSIGQLTIKSDSSIGDTAVVALSGMGTALPVPQLSLSTTELNFGSIAINASATQLVTLTSTGTAAVTVNAATIIGNEFRIVGAGLPVMLSPGQSITFQVQFIPSAADATSGQLTVSSNSNSGNIATVALSGTGIAMPNARLSVSSGSLSFDNVTVNTASVQYLTLTSTGTSPLTVSSIAITGSGFSIVAGIFPVTLDPNQSLTLQVQFNPATAGVATGQLTIISDAVNGRTTNLVLNGSGVDASPRLTASTTSMSFDSVSVNTPAISTLTLTSVGTTAVTVSGATVSGMDFSLVGGSFPVTLNPNRTMTLQIQFLPTTNGALSGSVTIASDSTTGNVTVALSGTGTGAAPEVDLVWDAPTISPTTVVGYNIYRSEGSSESFGVINPVPVTTVTYIDKAVVSGTNYLYVVKSVDESGAESAASNQIRLRIP
jgi:hypothetical protein